MKSTLEINSSKGICTIHLAEDMYDSETEEFIMHLMNNKDLKEISKFIVVVPSKFQACEDFRIRIHRLVHDASKSNPEFHLAVVTTLMQVVGYERVAKLVLQLVHKEQIFEKIDDAMDWIKDL